MAEPEEPARRPLTPGQEIEEAMRKYTTALPLPTASVDWMVLPEVVPAVRRFLEARGCVLTELNGSVTVKYPGGTRRVDVLPRGRYERYRVMLPDYTQLYELRPFASEGYSELWVPQEAFWNMCGCDDCPFCNERHRGAS